MLTIEIRFVIGSHSFLQKSLALQYCSFHTLGSIYGGSENVKKLTVLGNPQVFERATRYR